MHEVREPGWLEKVFEEAGKRVDEWPEWKKEIEAKTERFNGQKQSISSAPAKDDSQGEE
jgi:hypothetical protein